MEMMETIQPISGFHPARDLSSLCRTLIYDPSDQNRDLIVDCLGEGYQFTYGHNPYDLQEITAQDLDLAIWSLGEPYDESLSLLREFRAANSDLRVVLVAPSEALSCAAAIKKVGAEAFLLKPLRALDIKGGVARAMRTQKNLHAVESARVPLISAPESFHPSDSGRDLGLIGTSPEMRRVFSLIRKVGPAAVNVLVTGESGTGKEMVAAAIHQCSDRAKKPFIAINCAAIPKDLLESELFGHAKGAFTGATATRRGLFEEAHEGTILLDEIGDLPLPLQAKILRLLQTRQVKPLGQNNVREVDVRIISATHKNLKSLIQKGEFREDLYYRLNVMPIHLPPLRDRKEDILQIAEFFLNRYAERNQHPVMRLSRKAVSKLQALPWRGNVRELENVIERAIVISDGVEISDSDVMSEEVEPVRVTTEDLFNSGMTLRDIEREYIKYVLLRTGNRKEAATRVLGIDRKTLYRKEKLFGIRPTSDMN